MTTDVDAEKKDKQLQISYLNIKSSLRKEPGFPDPKNQGKTLSYALVLSKHEPSSKAPSTHKDTS